MWSSCFCCNAPGVDAVGIMRRCRHGRGGSVPHGYPHPDTRHMICWKSSFKLTSMRAPTVIAKPREAHRASPFTPKSSSEDQMETAFDLFHASGTGSSIALTVRAIEDPVPPAWNIPILHQISSTLLYSSLLRPTLVHSTPLHTSPLNSTHPTLIHSTPLHTSLTLLYSALLYSTLVYSTLLYYTTTCVINLHGCTLRIYGCQLAALHAKVVLVSSWGEAQTGSQILFSA